MTFKQALDSLRDRDIRGNKWLLKPFTWKECNRRLNHRSDYGAKYWVTEPKGAFGALKCVCGRLTKRMYPWFTIKTCVHPNVEVA